MPAVFVLTAENCSKVANGPGSGLVMLVVCFSGDVGGVGRHYWGVVNSALSAATPTVLTDVSFVGGVSAVSGAECASVVLPTVRAGDVGRLWRCAVVCYGVVVGGFELRAANGVAAREVSCQR